MKNQLHGVITPAVLAGLQVRNARRVREAIMRMGPRWCLWQAPTQPTVLQTMQSMVRQTILEIRKLPDQAPIEITWPTRRSSLRSSDLMSMTRDEYAAAFAGGPPIAPQCPKCHATSGNDWSHCPPGACPMRGTFNAGLDEFIHGAGA